MIRVIIPDETGHTEFAVDTLTELQEEVKKRDLSDKWCFIDGNYIKDLKSNEVTDKGIKEVYFIDALIGG